MFTSTDYDKLEQLMSEKPENRTLIQKLLSSQEETISAISHEIRNPLTLVYSTLQFLESRHPEIISDRYWHSMREDIEYMKQLLEELSSLNHSTSLSRSVFSFREFMEHIVLSFASSCMDGPIEFTSFCLLPFQLSVQTAQNLRKYFSIFCATQRNLLTDPALSGLKHLYRTTILLYRLRTPAVVSPKNSRTRSFSPL